MIPRTQRCGWPYNSQPPGKFRINYSSQQAIGLVGLWTCFSQRGVVDLRDTFGVYNMAAVNTPTIESDYVMGPVVRFTRANTEYMEINRAVLAGPPLTITCWFYSYNIAVEQTLVQFCDKDVADDVYALVIRGSIGGDPVTGVRVSGGAPSFCNTTTGYTATTWHHAAMVCPDNTNCSVYLDSGGKASVAAARAPAAWDRTTIGRAGDSTPANYTDGRVAEVRVYNRPLGDTDIQQMYSPMTRWELYRPPLWQGGVRFPRIPRPPAAYNTLAIY